MTAGRHELVPGSMVGAHRLERVLGRGGMGAVFLAYDTRLRRQVALKVLTANDAHASARLFREARSAAVLVHPHICTIHEVGESNGTAFITMEYVGGRTLRDHIDASAFTVHQAVRLAARVADALAYAHGCGVIHCDLKAANIILGDDNRLKLVDFGLARREVAAAPDATTGTTLAQPAAGAGTPYAMAPEQIRGELPGPASDVWALGVLLFEMLAKRKPFDAATVAELCSAILRDAPAALPGGLPFELQALVTQCLDKSPSRRGSARQVSVMLDELEKALAVGGPRTASRSDATPNSSSRGGARRILVLPFANISAEADTEYFADGLTEELITDLSHVRSLKVISRTSAMKLKGQPRDLRTLAGELNVDLVLDGSVRKAKNSVRIAAQLIDPSTNAPIWADKFSGAGDDLFDLQQKLSTQIIDAMQITLTAEEARRISERPIADARVYDLYLRARQKLGRFSAQDLDDAVILLHEGLELLGKNELLLGTLGHAHLYYVHWGVRPDPQHLDHAQRCADEVFTIAPESAHGQALVGALAMKYGNLQDAVRHLKRAVSADPANTEAAVWLIYCYLTAGQPRSARPLTERLLEIDPLTAINHASHGWLEMCEGRSHEAVERYQRARRLDPRAPLMCFLEGWAYAQAGREAEAIAALAAFGREAPNTVLGQLAAAFAHALAGGAVAAREAIDSQTELAGRYDAAIANFLAQIYACAGDIDAAFGWIEQAIKGGYLDYPGLATSNRLYGRLREDGRFVRLMSDVQRRWHAFEV